ncbi:hypothetical protein TRVL_03018 [Trypanosoma vivax]|nr:hypothetical protein TRVL_03018 [Trypanosoma vivax]
MLPDLRPLFAQNIAAGPVRASQSAVFNGETFSALIDVKHNPRSVIRTPVNFFVVLMFVCNTLLRQMWRTILIHVPVVIEEVLLMQSIKYTCRTRFQPCFSFLNCKTRCSSVDRSYRLHVGSDSHGH